MTELRKRLLDRGTPAESSSIGQIDIAGCAAVVYSSADPSHSIDHLLDGRDGRGGTRWVAANADAAEHIVIEFDCPQSISRLIYEVEETRSERTQEVLMEVSSDGGATLRQILVQEYTFSPEGATFQREDLRFQLDHVTHLLLTIVPNKRGSGSASLTSLRLFN